MKFYWSPGYVQDGKLDYSCGRIVIYKDAIIVGHNKSADHNYLLRSLAASYQLPKQQVISNAIRLYFKKEGSSVIINGVRNIDDIEFEQNIKFYASLIKQNFRA